MDPVLSEDKWFTLQKDRPSNLRTYIHEISRKRRKGENSSGIKVDAVSPIHRPLGPADFPLVCVIHNGMFYLPSFLTHYRKMGVTRFIFLGDRSNDGSREFLIKQDDVDLFTSNASYKESNGGAVWRDLLMNLYGLNRWYLSVDVDEFFVFPGSEKRHISEFVEDLEVSALKRSLAPLIDLYPDGPLGEATRGCEPDAHPTAIAGIFDGKGYRIEQTRNGTTIRGGPRERVFDDRIRLSKFPLIYADRKAIYNGASVHAPFPINRNFCAVTSVLLHLKFAAHSFDEFKRNAERQQHAADGAHYQKILDSGDLHRGLDLRCDHSVRFQDSTHMVKAGFMRDLRRAS